MNNFFERVANYFSITTLVVILFVVFMLFTVLLKLKHKKHQVAKELIQIEKYEIHAADGVSIDDIKHVMENDTIHEQE